MSNYFDPLKAGQNKVNLSYIKKKEFRLLECQKILNDLWTLLKNVDFLFLNILKKGIDNKLFDMCLF